jgi:hypothetical protein
LRPHEPCEVVIAELQTKPDNVERELARPGFELFANHEN